MGVSLASVFPDQAFTRGCPTREVLDHVMSKWAPLVLASLADGEPLRWSEVRRRAEGVSEKMLAQTLRTLEEDGLVLREARPVVPPHVEYSLTPLGRGLVDKLIPLLIWISHHADDMLERPSGKGGAAGEPGRVPGGRPLTTIRTMTSDASQPGAVDTDGQ